MLTLIIAPIECLCKCKLINIHEYKLIGISYGYTDSKYRHTDMYLNNIHHYLAIT